MGYREKLERGSRGSKVFSSSSSSSGGGAGCSEPAFWGESLGLCFLEGSGTGTGVSAQGHEM